MAVCVRHGGAIPNRPTVFSAADDRATVWNAQLAHAHNTLREQLHSNQVNLGATDAGGGDLLTHCLAFCSALTTHHRGEDAGLFAELLRGRPDVAPVITNLVENHQMITTILTSVRALSTEAGAATDKRLEVIGRELNLLAAILESHFGYEERAIGHALDSGILDSGWARPVLGFMEG